MKSSTVMGTLLLREGTMIHIAGWPVTLQSDVRVETNAVNIPLIQADMVTEGIDFLAGVPTEDRGEGEDIKNA